jgi:hypothetical protein
MKKFKHIKTREQFIKRANEKHNNFYDYSLVEFEDRGYAKSWNGAMTRKLPEYHSEAHVTIICPKHGKWSQRTRKHLEGSGCHSCAREAITKAIANRNGEFDFTTAHEFEETENYIVIKSTPSDQIEREVLINIEDKEILQYCKWYITGHQASRNSRTTYSVGGRSNRLISEGLDWLGTKPKMHRLILSRTLGRRLQITEYADHINHNGLDNRRGNLRLSTNAQNLVNQKKFRGNFSSQYKGVCYDKKGPNWMSYIGSNKSGSIVRRIYLGRWSPTPEGEEEAAKAYDKAAIKYYGERAVLNFPIEDYQ